jgi:multidrug resistance efflux pump
MKVEKAKARLERAKARFNRAQERVYDLLGWGTSLQLERANDSLSKARSNLIRAEISYDRLMHQTSKVR